MWNNLKTKINTQVYDYIQRHNLLEKYFFNFSQFNSYNLTLLNDNNESGLHSVKKNSFNSIDSMLNRKISFENCLDRSLIRSYDKMEENEEKDNVWIKKEFQDIYVHETSHFPSNYL